MKKFNRSKQRKQRGKTFTRISRMGANSRKAINHEWTRINTNEIRETGNAETVLVGFNS
jgi:hypothetical protein